MTHTTNVYKVRFIDHELKRYFKENPPSVIRATMFRDVVRKTFYVEAASEGEARGIAFSKFDQNKYDAYSVLIHERRLPMPESPKPNHFLNMLVCGGFMGVVFGLCAMPPKYSLPIVGVGATAGVLAIKREADKWNKEIKAQETN